MADQPEVTAERDARHLAAYKWMFNTSNLPDWYQCAGLGRDFTPIVDGILAAADGVAADPRIDKALALHKADGMGNCPACLCHTCLSDHPQPWPCATYRALTEDA